MTAKKIVQLFLYTFLLVNVLAQNNKTKLAQIMKTYHSYNMFDGAVLVAEEGKIIYKGSFGLANREWDIKNQTNTKFMIGSISKPLTAFLMLLQVQKGIIDLQKNIADYLPEFKNKPAAEVTIQQLLSHTSGLPNYDIIKDFFPTISRQNFTRDNYVKIFWDSALAFKPGTKYAYSSWGYFTLGYIMERVTGKSYDELMKEEVFDKLLMNNSGSYFHTQIIKNRAAGYDYNLADFASSDFRDQSNTMGTGDIYSTVEDLFKFHLSITNGTLLNKNFTSQMLASGLPPAQYGYGWFNKNFKYTDSDTVAANFHLGMTDGFVSFMLRIPENNSCVIILCNTSPTDFFGIVGNLVKVLYGKPVKIKKPVHKQMEVYISQIGAKSAVDEYYRLKKDTANYYIDWISMNFIAEQLLKQKKYDEAKIISENNVIEFSNKDLIMVTMGNIYLALNRNEQAIIYYKKTLAINPNYEEAKNRLKDLGQKIN